MGSSRDAAVVHLLLDGVLQPLARVMRVERVEGSGIVNSCEYQIVKKGSGYAGLHNADIIGLHNNEMVKVVVETRKGKNKTIHLGRATLVDIHSSGDGEHITFSSRLDDHLMGSPIHKAQFVNELSPSADPTTVGFGEFVVDSLVFNPIVDGMPWPNMVKNGQNRFFVSPNMGNRDTPIGGTKIRGQAFWGLADAVFMLLDRYNEPGLLQSPSYEEVLAAVGNTQIRDTRIAGGTQMVKALDDLLTPMGYTWRVDFDRPGFVFRSRANSTAAIALKQQKLYEQVDDTKTDVFQWGMSFDLARNVTDRLTLIGDTELVEGTFELQPGWDPAYDSVDPLTLNSGSPEIVTTPAKDRAWRDWVLNESGEYTNQRPNVYRNFNVGAVFEHNEYIKDKRRRFEPMLTRVKQDNKILTHKVLVEYLDGSTWREVSTLGVNYQVLTDECGIRFTDLSKISEVMYYKDRVAINSGSGWWPDNGPRIRITASVRSERRVSATEIPISPSRLVVERPRIVHFGDRYQLKRRAETGRYKSQFAGNSSFRVDARDDSEAIANLAAELVGNWSRATASATVLQNGVDFDEDYLGKRVLGLLPRNIIFATDSTQTSFPDVIGVTYDIQNQSTALTLDTYRGTSR